MGTAFACSSPVLRAGNQNDGSGSLTNGASAEWRRAIGFIDAAAIEQTQSESEASRSQSRENDSSP